MNVINLNTGLQTLTVDSTIITVDSTLITVDASYVEGDGLFSILITPRKFFPRMKLRLLNELTEKETIQECDAIKIKGLTRIFFSIDKAKEADSFEASVYDLNSNLLWRGKIFATAQENLQEYKMDKPNNNNIIEL